MNKKLKSNEYLKKENKWLKQLLYNHLIWTRFEENWTSYIIKECTRLSSYQPTKGGYPTALSKAKHIP